jgi:YHS domain-containing protein
MKSRMFFAAVAVLALVAGNALRAADEKATKELKCPVSGKAVNPEAVVEFNGGKVAFCCNNCPKEFQKNTAKYTAKANHQLVQSGQLKQVACPITGKDVNPEANTEVAGVKVGYCCMNCKGKVAKATEAEQLELAFGADAAKKAYKPAKEKK